MYLQIHGLAEKIFLSTSCTTMRDEDADNNTDFVMSNYNGPCVAGQTNWTNGRDFVVGSSTSHELRSDAPQLDFVCHHCP